MRRTPAATLVLAAAGLGAVYAAAGQPALTPSALRNHPAIDYQRVPPQDRVTRLNERLQRGELRLEFEPTSGYLRSVLSALRIPEESQLLVFSKTSFQARKIGPANPRALYFDDTVSVGWVRGGEVLEFVAQDPRQGAMFYTLEQNPDAAPQFRRNLSCVPCHTGEVTMNVPGMFLGSVYPDPEGSMIYAPVFSSNHGTRFDVRWGGWYVTGRHDLPRHLGNATVAPGTWNEDMVTAATVRLTSLEGRFDPAGYPSLHSDMVALMVLEHQAHLLNLFTRLGWESRIGAAGVASRDPLVADLVDYLLFVNEEPLPGPVTGTSGFATTFTARGPRDSKGRSLRDFDLRTRLMRYPCSFLIYSEPFDALPDAARSAIYARMWKVLSGQVSEARYARLSAADRQAVVEILRDTKPGLPSYFGPSPSGPSPGHADQTTSAP
jgi:hypothetical protein